MIDVRFATLEERAQVEALSQLDKSIKDFKFNWQRWQHWHKGNYPIVVTDDQIVIGFHAATFNKRNEYVNSYYQFTSLEYRGKGYGAAMVDFLLFTATKRGQTRLKMQTPKGSDGQKFWMGFGLQPFGYNRDHLFFDVDIDGSSEVFDLIELSPLKYSWRHIPESSQRNYQLGGVKLFT